MCIEVIICQFWWGPLWKVDDISDPWHGGTSNQLRWEKECGENCPNFWCEFCQNLSFSKWDIPNLPKFWAFHIFYISVIANTTAMVVKSYIVLYMCVEVIICQSDRSPERKMIFQTLSILVTSNQLRWEKECGEKSPNFWQWVLQNPPFSKQDIPNLPKLWHFTSFTFLYLSILQLRYWIVMQYCTCGWKL